MPSANINFHKCDCQKKIANQASEHWKAIPTIIQLLLYRFLQAATTIHSEEYILIFLWPCMDGFEWMRKPSLLLSLSCSQKMWKLKMFVYSWVSLCAFAKNASGSVQTSLYMWRIWCVCVCDTVHWRKRVGHSPTHHSNTIHSKRKHNPVNLKKACHSLTAALPPLLTLHIVDGECSKAFHLHSRHNLLGIVRHSLFSRRPSSQLYLI